MSSLIHTIAATVRSHQRIATLVCITLLLIIGGSLRSNDLGTQPYWMDEGYTINAVLSIAETGRSVLDSGLPYSCPIYCYPTAFIAETFGHSAESYRVLAAIAGTIFIGVMYFVGTRLFSTSVGLITAFITAFSYYQIAWSRQARWYTLFALFFWLALFFFYQALYRKERRALMIALTVLTTLLAILTHGLGYLLPFIFLIWIAVELFVIRRTFSWKAVALILSSTIAVTVLLDVIIGTNRFTSLLTEREFHFSLPYYASFYVRTYWFLLLFALVALFFHEREHRRAVFLLCTTILAYLIPLSFLTDIIHYRYLFHLTPALFILAALGAMIVVRAIRSGVGRGGFAAAALTLFFTVGTGVVLPQSMYLLESDDPERSGYFIGTRAYFAYTPQPDWNSAYAFIDNTREQGDIIISSHPHFNKLFLGEPGYWIRYHYLGMSDLPGKIVDGREYYVGATVLNDLAEFEALTNARSGFVIVDYMALDGRIPDEIQVYIDEELELVFHDRINEYSQVWVYRF